MLAVLMSGCAADPSVEPTPTPTFANDDEAFAAAEATYRAYVDALNQVDLADPATFEEVYAWTTGEANADARELFSKMHASGETVSGDSVVKAFEPNGVGENGEALTADVCVDVADVDVRDSNGVSVVAPDRVDVQVMRLAFLPSGTVTGLAIASITGRNNGLSC